MLTYILLSLTKYSSKTTLSVADTNNVQTVDNRQQSNLSELGELGGSGMRGRGSVRFEE